MARPAMDRATDLLDLQLAVVRDEYERLSGVGRHTTAQVDELVAAMDGLTEAWTALVSELLWDPGDGDDEVDGDHAAGGSSERRGLETLLRRLAVLRSKAIALHLTARP